MQGERARACGAAGCADGACQGAPPSCGDGTCDASLKEDCSNCPNDCRCSTPNTCQAGACQPPLESCGDGACDATKGENCNSCANDCACPTGQQCQNDTCQTPPAPCGDGTCDAAGGENCDTCAKDCVCKSGQQCRLGACIVVSDACGDGTCDAAKGEDCDSCVKDCACKSGQSCRAGQCITPSDSCGNGTCEAGKGEDCGSCAKDCACPTGQSCQSGLCKAASQHWPQTPPVLHPTDKRRLSVDGKTWYPVGYYPGAGMNMTGIDYKGDVYLYWKTFVDKLDAAGLDFFRIWVNWGALPSQGSDDNWDRHVMTPYLRNSAGKVDLSKFNPDFFKLLKTFADYTHAKGIIVQMSLLDCWHVSTYGAQFGVQARDFFKKANNVNGVDFTDLAQWTDPSGKIFPYHKRFVEEVVKTIGDKPNIIWETCNELILGKGDSHHKSWATSKSQPFHKAIAQVIRDQEQRSGFRRHLIMPVDLPEHRTVGGHGDISAAANTTAHQALVSQYAWDIPLISDNDCFCKTGTAAERRQRGWAVLTAGAQLDLFDNEAYKQSVLTGTALSSSLAFLGHIKTFLQQSKIELAGMKPSDSLVSGGGWSLAAPGDRFIVYLPNGGSTTVQQLPGQRTARWFNPRSGAFAGAAGNGPTFQAPDTNDWVLLIQSGGTPSACGNGTCEAAKGEDCGSCAKDCGCPSGQSCQSGQCKAAPKCIQATVPDFAITSQNPGHFTQLPMTDGQTYSRFKVSFEVNPTRWQPDCFNTYYSPPRPMSPYQVLVEIRKVKLFCRGGNVFGVNVRGGGNGDIWADTYHKPAPTSSCGGATQHQLLSSRPKHGLQTGTFTKVTVEYEPAVKKFVLTIGGKTFSGTAYAQAILKATSTAPLFLHFSLERWLECFDKDGNKDSNANCCHLPSLGWQYRNISYEICP